MQALHIMHMSDVYYIHNHHHHHHEFPTVESDKDEAINETQILNTSVLAMLQANKRIEWYSCTNKSELIFKTNKLDALMLSMSKQKPNLYPPPRSLKNENYDTAK